MFQTTNQLWVALRMFFACPFRTKSNLPVKFKPTKVLAELHGVETCSKHISKNENMQSVWFHQSILAKLYIFLMYSQILCFIMVNLRFLPTKKTNFQLANGRILPFIATDLA